MLIDSPDTPRRTASPPPAMPPAFQDGPPVRSHQTHAPAPVVVSLHSCRAPQVFGLRTSAQNPTTRRPLLRSTPPRPSPHRTATKAASDTLDTALTPAHRTTAPPCRAKNRPHTARPPPRIRCRPQAKDACRPPAKSAFMPRRQKQGPLRGGFHWGAPQAPAIMPWLTPGHPPRLPRPPVGRLLPPHKAGFAEHPLGADRPKPRPKGI